MFSSYALRMRNDFWFSVAAIGGGVLTVALVIVALVYL